MLEVPCECKTAAEGAAESRDSREEGSKGQEGRTKGTDLSAFFFYSLGRMKALQKNQGRTDQLLGAMADLLTSVAIPNQQWVSWRPAGGGSERRRGVYRRYCGATPLQGGILFFSSGAPRVRRPASIPRLTSQRASFDS